MPRLLLSSWSFVKNASTPFRAFELKKKNILQFLNFWINEHKSRDTMGAPRAPQVWARTSSSGGVIASHESRREAVLGDVEILNFRPSISPEKSDPFSQPFSLHDKNWINWYNNWGSPSYFPSIYRKNLILPCKFITEETFWSSSPEKLHWILTE